MNIRVFFILLLLCFLCYGAGVNNQFMIDDFGFFAIDHNNDFPEFRDYFTKTHSQHYSPVYYIFNSWIFRVFQHQPLPLHVISIFLHALVCFLLYHSIKTLLSRQDVALLTGVLFAVHPVNSFVLNYITANFVFLYAIFLLLSLLMYWRSLEFPKHALGWKAGALASFALGLLSFEGAVLYPIYLGICLLFIRKYPIKKVLVQILPYMAFSALYLFLWKLIASANAPIVQKIVSSEVSLGSYVASLNHLVGWYVGNLLWPKSVVYIYNILPLQGADITRNVIIFFFSLTGVLWLAIIFRRSPAVFGLAWFLTGFILLCPAVFAHFNAMGFVIEPHWFYFSSMGFMFLVSYLLVQLKARVNPRLWWITILALICYLVIFIPLYLLVGKTEQRYCEYWLKESPGNSIARKTLGYIYSEHPETMVKFELVEEMIPVVGYYLSINETARASRLLEKINQAVIRQRNEGL